MRAAGHKLNSRVTATCNMATSPMFLYSAAPVFKPVATIMRIFIGFQSLTMADSLSCERDRSYHYRIIDGQKDAYRNPGSHHREPCRSAPASCHVRSVDLIASAVKRGRSDECRCRKDAWRGSGRFPHGGSPQYRRRSACPAVLGESRAAMLEFAAPLLRRADKVFRADLPTETRVRRDLRSGCPRGTPSRRRLCRPH